jgi:uncharacterized protein YhaN
MSDAELVFDGQTFQIARRSFAATYELFAENIQLLAKAYEVRSHVSEAHFRLFLAAMEGTATEIGMPNAIALKSLSSEFQFLEVVPLGSAVSDPQMQLAGQDRELCQLVEANGRSRAKWDSQLEGLRGAIDEVAKKQRHEREKVSGLRKAMGKVRRQIEGVMIQFNQTEDAVEPRVGPLERAALGLAKTTDRKSWVESEVVGLRAAMADGSAKAEEVRRGVAGLKAEFSDC